MIMNYVISLSFVIISSNVNNRPNPKYTQTNFDYKYFVKFIIQGWTCRIGFYNTLVSSEKKMTTLKNMSCFLSAFEHH